MSVTRVCLADRPAEAEGLSIVTAGCPSSEDVSESLVERIVYQKGKPNLDLSLCTLHRVPLDAILTYYGEDVKSLDLSFNFIRFLPPQFAVRLATLTYLDLSKNRLRKLPDNFGVLDQLRYLDLHQNELQTLPMSMGKMRRLKSLNLSDNAFEAPICNILEHEKLRRNKEPEKAAIDSAPLIIEFLGQMYSTIYHRPGYGATGLSETSIARREVTFDSEFTGDESDDEHEIEGQKSDDMNLRQRRLSRRQGETSLSSMEPQNKRMSKKMMIIGGLLLGILLILGIPVITACLFGTPYLDATFEKRAAGGKFWGFYRPYQVAADWALNWIGITENTRPFYVTEPASPVEPGFFQNAYRSTANLFGSIFNTADD